MTQDSVVRSWISAPHVERYGVANHNQGRAAAPWLLLICSELAMLHRCSLPWLKSRVFNLQMTRGVQKQRQSAQGKYFFCNLFLFPFRVLQRIEGEIEGDLFTLHAYRVLLLPARESLFEGVSFRVNMEFVGLSVSKLYDLSQYSWMHAFVRYLLGRRSQKSDSSYDFTALFDTHQVPDR